MSVAATWRRWTAALLVISALLFGAAVLAEGGESAEATHSEAAERAEEAPELAAESPQSDEAGEESRPGNEAAELDVEIDETLFGVDLENPLIVWGFVIASLALAAAVLANVRYALILALVLGVAAALLDGREVLLQLAESNPGIAGLAAAAAVAHAAVAVLALLAWRAGTAKTART